MPVERLGIVGAETMGGGRAGGVSSRIFAMIVNEATFALMDSVASPADSDTALRLGANYPQGPLALADAIGLDVILQILEALQRESGEERYRAPLLRMMIAAGWTGRAAGRGFFTYETGQNA